MLWEIRLANQDPIRIEVDDARNLREEYALFEEEHAANRWKFWRRLSPFWQVTDNVAIHRELIAGVLTRKPKAPKNHIGFPQG
jgi:hypothetical protein